jgi:hypothetical protein
LGITHVMPVLASSMSRMSTFGLAGAAAAGPTPASVLATRAQPASIAMRRRIACVMH